MVSDTAQDGGMAMTAMTAATTTTATTTATTAVPESGFAARGVPRLLLRLEGLAILVAALVAYRWLGGAWTTFAWLFLVPDLSMLGFLAGPRVGAIAYNAAHSYLGAALLAGCGALFSAPLWSLLAAIWVAHIGLDRALGYGLKYGSAFADTHLGRIGRFARRGA
jgi:hypothetical protein